MFDIEVIVDRLFGLACSTADNAPLGKYDLSGKESTALLYHDRPFKQFGIEFSLLADPHADKALR